MPRTEPVPPSALSDEGIRTMARQLYGDDPETLSMPIEELRQMVTEDMEAGFGPQLIAEYPDDDPE